MRFFWESVVFKWVVAAVCVAIFVGGVVAGGSAAYQIVTTCWACDVFRTIYDSLSKTAFDVFELFQGKAILLLSVGLALWMVYETYTIFITGMGINPEIKLDAEYFKKIYKKIFLATAIIGLFLINTPRNVFANTFEVILDFGSGIGRQLLHGKIAELGAELPAECTVSDRELRYSAGMALSDTTRDNMVCLMREVDVVRRDYIALGQELFEHGTTAMIVDVALQAGIRIGATVASFLLRRHGSTGWLKGKEKKIARQDKKVGELAKKIEEATRDRKPTDALQRQLESAKRSLERNRGAVKKVADDFADNAGRNFRTRQVVGKAISKTNGFVADAISVGHFIADEDFRMGIAGIVVLGGFFFVNLLFSFILIENLLFFGIAIVIFPFLAACYVFEGPLRGFATHALKSQFAFAIGLIFMCLATVMCAELNDWILGGMISSPDPARISGTRYAIELLRAGDVDGYNDIVGTGWFFLYALFAVMVNGRLLVEARKFAGWFTGTMIEGTLGKNLATLGKSAVATLTSVTRTGVKGALKEPSKGKATFGDTLRWIGGKFKGNRQE
jgi:hypothetical protein